MQLTLYDTEMGSIVLSFIVNTIGSEFELNQQGLKKLVHCDHKELNMFT